MVFRGYPFGRKSVRQSNEGESLVPLNQCHIGDMRESAHSLQGEGPVRRGQFAIQDEISYQQLN